MKRWRAVYITLINTALLIVLLQWGVHGAILAYQAMAQRMLYEPPLNYAVRALPDLSPDDLEDLWRVTGWMPFRFGGSAGFLHEQTTSKFVNINQYGIRSNGDPSRPIDALDNATWFFGGSTSYGFGVPDNQTIPAYLEQITGAPVINLAVRGHGSTMENRLFRTYLRAGYRPRRVVFLDGINEVCEPDLFSEQMKRLTIKAQEGYRWDFGAPVVFAFNTLANALMVKQPYEREEGPELALSCTDYGRFNRLGEIVERNLRMRQAACDMDNVPCHTFIQPFGGVHGQHEDQRFLASHEARELQNLFRHLEPVWSASGATFVTNALDGVSSGLWVDEIHYSPVGNKLIAAAIARQLRALDPTP
ncbi:MAG: hypothetical protein RLZZ53_626 [Acidobacteriota bacterium]